MTQEFEWSPRPGGNPPVDPNVAGRRLRALAEEKGGITPADVVEDARPKNAPLHPAFEWDNLRAAEMYRQVQARGLIKQLRPIRTEPSEPRLAAFQSVVVDTGRRYVATDVAMAAPDLRRQVLAQFDLELRRAIKRYEDAVSAAAIVEALDRAAREAEAREREKAPAA